MLKIVSYDKNKKYQSWSLVRYKNGVIAEIQPNGSHIIRKSTASAAAKARKYIKKQSYLNIQQGGYSQIGPRPGARKLIDRIAYEWYNNSRKMVWWSSGQPNGYYFTNLKNTYMSSTHIHIYKCSLDSSGNITCMYSTKVNNISKGGGKKFKVNSIGNVIKEITRICSELFNNTSSGPRVKSTYDILDKVARKWWEEGRMVWYTPSQPGYYFTLSRELAFSDSYVYIYRFDEKIDRFGQLTADIYYDIVKNNSTTFQGEHTIVENEEMKSRVGQVIEQLKIDLGVPIADL
tara:strand:- start:226 stop:1095 length:870 start_codon:yes stop_codon:yes gene_type:complete